jgi:hypothetical protein
MSHTRARVRVHGQCSVEHKRMILAENAISTHADAGRNRFLDWPRSKQRERTRRLKYAVVYSTSPIDSSHARHRGSHQTSHPISCARSHFFRNRGYRRRCAYAEFREISAVLHAFTTWPFWRRAARNGSRHGNARDTHFDGCLGILPQNVHMNVNTDILDASALFRRKPPLGFPLLFEKGFD